MNNLYDLIIYSLEDGEDISKFSAEHITGFYMGDTHLVVESDQINTVRKYDRSEVGFYFVAR